ncbi:hypothetical protein COLO4_32995 [Corchorus olitorius]|uniref:F-box domain-containing protein n=1 Tax=Corchorus olitorius TaxID=93759 RepID=A0A1R3GWZ5_9ROSI|nr:hypothetical protein COLO4_32995 [Corchorus olitorius]
MEDETKRITPNSAEQVVNNKDLLTEILLRVASKSVLKFKRVSKQWRRTYFICNPTTREYKILPTPPVDSDHLCSSASLAFDPLKSPHYKIIYVSVSKAADKILI